MPKIIFSEEQKQYIIKEYVEKKRSAANIGKEVGCSSTTLLKNLKEWGVAANTKALDLSGKRFGRLVAIQPAIKKNPKDERKWFCQCDCGNTTEVLTENLTSGHTTSCGCSKLEHFALKDLVGQTFGRLTVIENLSGGKKLCKCSCGNTIEVITYNLLSGNTQSCGCLQRDRSSEQSFKSLVGQKYGKLTVIERVENNRFNHTVYKCKCDCGGIICVDSSNLRQGTTNSCGCLKSKGEMIINQHLQKYNINFLPQYSVPGMYYNNTGRAPLFDFALFDDNNNLKCLIEYNGIQHYEATGGWNDENTYQITRNRDIEKKELCKTFNIPLYIIKYNENIGSALESIIKESALEPDMEEADGLDETGNEEA